jgi:hypothetical protein
VVSRALVLGSGGNTGFSWQWGVLASLHDVGVDLRGADLTGGTLAGSAAAVEFVGGADPRDLLDALANDRLSTERDAPVETDGFGPALVEAIKENTGAQAILTAIGALALGADGGSAEMLRHARHDAARLRRAGRTGPGCGAGGRDQGVLAGVSRCRTSRPRESLTQAPRDAPMFVKSCGGSG